MALITTLALAGCQTLREIGALQNVRFDLQGIQDVRLADVRMDDVRSYGDLGLRGTAAILGAVASGRLPLELQVDVLAENPADNSVVARMVRMDWALLMEGKETVTGSLAEPFSLEPGQPTVVPVRAGLDLLEFFDGSGQDLVDLVLALTDRGGASKVLAVRIQPTIETPLGAMRYPRPITVVQQRVGDTD